MVGNEIENNLHLPAMEFGNELIEISERTEDRIDARVVRNIVAEVRHGRGIDWREPNRIDAEPIEIIEARNDSRQISDAVAAGVLKRARVDLVNDPLLPPLVLLAGSARVHDGPLCSKNQANLSARESLPERSLSPTYLELLTFSAASTAAGRVGSAMPRAPRPSRRRSFTS